MADNSQRLAKILDLCSPTQRQWIIARLSARTDAEAAREVKVAPATVSRWKQEVPLDEALLLLQEDKAQAAVLEGVELLPRAVHALGKALQDRRTQVSAANSLLDRFGLPATTNTEQKGEVVIRIYRDDKGRG